MDLPEMMIDNDDNGSGPNTGPIVTSTLQLYCGLEPEGAFMTENSTVDFCFKANCNLPNPLAAFSCENADTICDLAIPAKLLFQDAHLHNFTTNSSVS